MRRHSRYARVAVFGRANRFNLHHHQDICAKNTCYHGMSTSKAQARKTAGISDLGRLCRLKSTLQLCNVEPGEGGCNSRGLLATCHWDSLIKTSACSPSRRSQRPLQSDGNKLWKFQFSGIRWHDCTARGILRGSRRVQCHGCGKQLLELRRFMIRVCWGPYHSKTSRNLPLETNFDKVL